MSAIPHGDAVPALHNSGPSPQSVYRTAAVGRTYRLEPLVLLYDPSSSDERVAPDRLARALLDEIAPARASCAAAAERARRLAAIDAIRDADDRARAALTELARCLADLGWLRPFHGVVREQRRPSPPAGTVGFMEHTWPWLPQGAEHAAIQRAWRLCAMAHFSPPLVLWTRPASLVWWRDDYTLELRWFGTPPADAGAPRS